MSKEKVQVAAQIYPVNGVINVDYRYGPYDSIAEAVQFLGAGNLDCIKAGLKFGVKETDGTVTDYVFLEDNGGADKVRKVVQMDEATAEKAGLMSAQDKTALAAVQVQAQQNTEAIGGLEDDISEANSNIQQNTARIGSINTAITQILSAQTELRTAVNGLTGIDNTNFKGFFPNVEALPDMDRSGWALVGSSLASLLLYTYTDINEIWTKYSNDTYDFTDYSGLVSQVATIGLNLDALQTTVGTKASQSDLNALATTVNSKANASDVGNLANLTTTAKNNIVAAVNEVKAATEDLSGDAADISYTDNQGLSTDNVQDAIDNIAERVNTYLGDYYLEPSEQAQATAGKYMANSGSINNSSTQTMTVAFYEIPAGMTIDKVKVSVPKTGSASSAIVGAASSLSATSCTVLVQGSSAGVAWSGEVSVPSARTYIVVCYNASSGLPTVSFHVADTGLDEIGETFSLTYTRSDCEFFNVVKTNGTISTESGYKCSDYIRLYNPTLCVATTTTANSSVHALLYYDENKAFISSITSVVRTAAKFAVPSNARYIRINCKKGDEYTFSSEGIDGLKNRIDYIENHETPGNLKILHFGNSFTANTTSNISDILSAVGADNVHVNYVPVGSASLQYWCEQIDGTDSSTLNVAAGMRIDYSANIKTIMSFDWDIIVFQQVSTDSGNYSTYMPYLAKLISYARRLCKNKDMKIAFNFTWSTASVTYSSIISAVKTMKEKFGEQIDILIPAGTALENIRNTSIAVGANDFRKDVKHLATGVGEYVAGCAYYCALIQPFTGKSIYQDTTTTITTTGGTGEVDVTAENRELCQKAGDYATRYKFEVLDIENL